MIKVVSSYGQFIAPLMEIKYAIHVCSYENLK